MNPTEHEPTEIEPTDLTQVDRRFTDFETRLRFGLSEVLHERPELREALPLAAMLDDSVRWCA